VLRPLVLVTAAACAQAQHSPRSSWIVGDPADVRTPAQPGFVLAGGGADQDAAMRWLLHRSGGGDVVVVRASGGDGYNSYLKKLAPVDSVESLVLNTPELAQDPAVADKIRRAEALFIAGGDQWNYVRLWRGSPVGDALQFLIDRGVPFGGTSAGLAVLGEFVFTAHHDTVTSAQALADPYDDRVTIGTNFLRIAALKNTITDSHFHARDRMGRTLVFLARMLADHKLREARAIAIDERAAALLDPTRATATVEGRGSVYFLRANRPADVCRPGEPLTFKGVSVYRVSMGGSFDLRTWTGQGAVAYGLHVEKGRIRSTQRGGHVY
jgi:cyanophycinase